MAWDIVPLYRGCTTVREWDANWNGQQVQRFDTKREAKTHAAANPDGPRKMPHLTYVDGKRVWNE